jgi:FKBP-type peptidyl-prolyl cis-trans isomerase
MNRLFLIIFVLGLLFVHGCKKDDDPVCTPSVPADRLTSVDQTRLAADIQTIDNYLTTNGITGVQFAPSQSNGVRYVITQLGTGAKLSCLENRMTVKYKGSLLVKPDGEFDSSSSPVSFRLSGLILGWQMVLPLIPAGSKVNLYIPSGYGYGMAGGGGGKIPVNANLIFEIELIAVN